MMTLQSRRTSLTTSPLFTRRGTSLVLTGTLHGMLAGGFLSLIYSLAAGLIVGGYASAFSLSLFLASFGLIPALILGTLTGALISLLVIEFAPGSHWHAAMLGGLIPVQVISLLLAWTIFTGAADNRGFWTLVIGLPSLIYIGSGILFGWFFYRRLPPVWRSVWAPRFSPYITVGLLFSMLLIDVASLFYIL